MPENTIISLGSTGEYQVHRTDDGEFVETREGPERSIFYVDGVPGIRRNLEPGWPGETLPWTDEHPLDALTDGGSVAVDPDETAQLHDGSFDGDDQRYVHRWDWMAVVIDVESDGVGCVDVSLSDETELNTRIIENTNPEARDRMEWRAAVSLYKWDDEDDEWATQHIVDDVPDDGELAFNHPSPGSWDEGDTLLVLMGGPWSYSVAEPDLPVTDTDVSIRGGCVIEHTEFGEREEGEGEQGNARYKIRQMTPDDLTGDIVPAITDVGARLGDIEIPGPD